MDRNEQQLSSNNIISPTPLTPTSDRSLQGSKSAETLLTSELKNYFGQLLSSSRPQKKTSSRKRLGESLTSEEAMHRVQEDLEEKKKRKTEEKTEK